MNPGKTEADREVPPPLEPSAQTHPRGLYTLFFTEMWERFSFYGMRALLVLFMVDAVRNGGMGLTDEIATAIYGLYSAAVYLACLPGGWLADRLFGAQKSVWYGGIVIATGHFVLAIPRTDTFYLGLILVVLGTGLLKPNISAMVGELYPEGGARRDAGFTIFYMGINLGAAIGPLICSTLGEKMNWHYGFAAAGVGMVMGLIQFRLSAKHLGEAGLRPGHETGLSKRGRVGLVCVLVTVVLVVGLSLAGIIRINPVALARSTGAFLVAVAILYFAWVLLFFDLDRTEKQRVGVIVILFIAAALFWAGFEQAGSTFNLFAERYTARNLGLFDFVIPTGWFQSLGPVFIISLAPVMAALWVALSRRNLNPSLPVKFGLGLILLSAGFVVMAGAAELVAAGHKVWPTWLIATYLLHTFGELCLSPVGLSSVTKLAPRRLVGQMMGIWFLGSSLGNLIAGLIAGQFKADAVQEMPGQYLQIGILPLAAGVALILLAKPIKKWMVGVK
jgi:POT family proton-dependent oligopeptide transporter